MKNTLLNFTNNKTNLSEDEEKPFYLKEIQALSKAKNPDCVYNQNLSAKASEIGQIRDKYKFYPDTKSYFTENASDLVSKDLLPIIRDELYKKRGIYENPDLCIDQLKIIFEGIEGIINKEKNAEINLVKGNQPAAGEILEESIESENDDGEEANAVKKFITQLSKKSMYDIKDQHMTEMEFNFTGFQNLIEYKNQIKNDLDFAFENSLLPNLDLFNSNSNFIIKFILILFFLNALYYNYIIIEYKLLYYLVIILLLSCYYLVIILLLSCYYLVIILLLFCYYIVIKS